MKPNPQDNPDLTAFALGELHARQARDIHALLTDSVAAHELEQIEAVTDALRQGAPIPQERLRPDQRHAVLYPANLPRRMAPLMPRPLPRRSPKFRVMVAGVLKAAAVVAVTGAAYLVGRHVSLQDSSPALAMEPTSQPATTVASASIQPEIGQPLVDSSPVGVTTANATSQISVAEFTPAIEKAPVLVVAAPAADSQLPATSTQPALAKVAAKATTPVPVLAVAKPMPVTTPGRHLGFVNASRQPVDQFALHPSQIRPLPAKTNKRELLAAPLPLQPAAAPAAKEGTRARTPELYIHSWKADVTTCPWDENRRLLQVTVQIPADQPATASTGGYRLQVSFDPNNVREYRQLCERHLPAQELRSAGTHVVWYEYLPNGHPDANKTVATVTLDKSRFTTQTVGPFDESRLSVQDRGEVWQNARGDFLFDTAVVGFGLLMRGVPQTPGLNHALVLSLAEKSPGGEADAERARFIRLVKEAAGAAGL